MFPRPRVGGEGEGEGKEMRRGLAGFLSSKKLPVPFIPGGEDVSYEGD